MRPPNTKKWRLAEMLPSWVRKGARIPPTLEGEENIEDTVEGDADDVGPPGCDRDESYAGVPYRGWEDLAAVDVDDGEAGGDAQLAEEGLEVNH